MLKFIQPKSAMEYWDTRGKNGFLDTIRVNTVNCVGVMGRGIALDFKRRYPQMYAEYREHCRKGEYYPGSVFQYQARDCLILNVATKDHWKDPSQMKWISHILEKVDNILMRRPESEKDVVTMPALGCGNGGLDWLLVKAQIEKFLVGLKCQIHVFEPPQTSSFF